MRRSGPAPAPVGREQGPVPLVGAEGPSWGDQQPTQAGHCCRRDATRRVVTHPRISADESGESFTSDQLRVSLSTAPFAATHPMVVVQETCPDYDLFAGGNLRGGRPRAAAEGRWGKEKEVESKHAVASTPEIG